MYLVSSAYYLPGNNLQHTVLCMAAARPDLSKFSRSQLQVAFKQGTRVIRGRDWTYGTQDGNLPGTVTGNFTTTNFLQVTWDNGKVYSYRLGSGKYDLYLQIPRKYHGIWCPNVHGEFGLVCAWETCGCVKNLLWYLSCLHTNILPGCMGSVAEAD